MRAMEKPKTLSADAFALCISGIVNFSLKERVLEIESAFVAASQDYTSAGVAKSFYSLPADNRGKDEISAGRVTKSELKNLYTYYLVEKDKPGRIVYDSLLASAPSGICPLCGAGYAVTLDHYLPKSKFPLLSISPLNLIPACRDCNTGKLTAYAQAYDQQSLHPYFDHGLYQVDRWLTAEVLHSAPASIRFSTDPPKNWSDGDKERVKSHFTSLKLGERYAVLAAGELGSISAILRSFISKSGRIGVQEYLKACAASESDLHKNSWKTAMFHALANDDWFCQTGYQLI